MTAYPSLKLPDLDQAQLEQQLDFTKTRVFLGGRAAFLAPIMTTLGFEWYSGIPTACTDGVRMQWNPHYFHYLTQKGRESVYVHELWHTGLLHVIRRGNRDPYIWNYACDIYLDNDMGAEGYELEGLFPVQLGYRPGTKACANPKYIGWVEEDIYDDLIKSGTKPPPDYKPDMQVLEPGQGSAQQAQQMVAIVVSAMQQAKKADKPGTIPGQLAGFIDKFLKPKLPWNQLLYKFFNELGGAKEQSWRRPNRRYIAQGIYMPGRVPAHSALDHLAFFMDVSGSVGDEEERRFVSEFKHVKDTFQPEKITIIQFDTQIQMVKTYGPDDAFDKFQRFDGGGTSLVCVRDWIIKHRPTAAMVFSDLYCRPMRPLPKAVQVPMIWIGVNARPDSTVPHGQLIHIREE